MKRSYSISISAIFFFSFLMGASTPLKAAPAIEKVKVEALSTREAIPQKFSEPTEAVKTFLTAMKDKDFDLAWESLSTQSQNQFIRSFAASRGISTVKARDLFDKSKESVRAQFWNPLRERSKMVSLVQDAVYIKTGEKDNQAMVEMKSGGITYHVKAVREGKEWRAAYVESALQESLIAPPPPPPQTVIEIFL